MNIFDAIRNDDIESVKRLLPKININSKSNLGFTPLITSLFHDTDEITLLLLTDPNIDVNIRNESLDYPLFFSFYKDKDIHIIKSILSHKSFNIKKYLLFNTLQFFNFSKFSDIHNTIFEVEFNTRPLIDNFLIGTHNE